MNALLKDLSQLTRLRTQREQKAQLHLQAMRKLLREAELVCQQQRGVIEALERHRAGAAQQFAALCVAGAIAMQDLEGHRLGVVLMDKEIAAAQHELAQRHKAQEAAQAQVDEARARLLVARKAIEKMSQAVQLATTAHTAEAEQQTDRSEEEVLEAMLGHRK